MSFINDINHPKFFSNENFDQMGEPAEYADYAPGPNESVADALKSSPSLRALQRHGVATPQMTMPGEPEQPSQSQSQVVEQLSMLQQQIAALQAQLDNGGNA